MQNTYLSETKQSWQKAQAADQVADQRARNEQVAYWLENCRLSGKYGSPPQHLFTIRIGGLNFLLNL
jgi:hypothetical protein